MDKAFRLDDLISERPQNLPPFAKEHFNKVCEKRQEPKTTDENLTFLVHVLMLECGFVFDDTSFDRGSIYEQARFLLNVNKCQHLTSIKPLRAGPVLLLIGIYHGEELFTVTLTDIVASKYVQLEPCTIERRYRHLKELSRMFKNKIAWPILFHHLHQSEDCSFSIPSLQTCPPELLYAIFAKLDNGVSLCNLERTCKTLREICVTDQLWKSMFKKNFSDRYRIIQDPLSTSDWKLLYKEAHTQRSKRMRNTEVINDPGLNFPRFRQPFPRFDPPFGTGPFFI